MNPYLERYWPDFHTRLMVALSNALQPQLPEGLVATVEEFLTVDTYDDEEFRSFRADLLVAHTWSETPKKEEQPGGLAVVEPDVYQVLQTQMSRRIEILDLSDGSRMVTVIEVLSPTNKRDGRDAYRDKSRLLRESGVNLVEIDLLRNNAVAVPLDEIPAHKLTPYLVCSTRGGEGGRFNVWHIGLWQRLPCIAIPLRRTDSDVALDLQPLVEAVYRDGRYDRRIDYRRPLDPPFPPEAQAKVEEFLSIARS